MTRVCYLVWYSTGVNDECNVQGNRATRGRQERRGSQELPAKTGRMVKLELEGRGAKKAKACQVIRSVIMHCAFNKYKSSFNIKPHCSGRGRCTWCEGGAGAGWDAGNILTICSLITRVWMCCRVWMVFLV